MADSPQSDTSHDSLGGSSSAHASKTPAVKDKQCQYCGQVFTSSSLGRHLDQYLHKKKPDGIHIVDEIRQLRGGITRRTARHSKAHEHDEETVKDASPAQSLPSLHVIDTLNTVPSGGLDARFNAPHWHTTGVITDLSTFHAASPSTPSVINSLKRPYSSLVTPSNGDSETTRALELSLREVLDSLRAATTRAQPRSSPFDFDLQSQTFPSLCLTLLPTPPTLFSPSPFASSTSCSLEAPGKTHLELLRLNLSTKIQRWKWNCLRHAQHLTYPTETSEDLGDEADYLSRTAAQYEEMASKHLDLAFTTWMAEIPEGRQSMWQIELLRAYNSEQKKTKDLQDQLDRVSVECRRLEGQIEQLSRCQWPREMALWPPERSRFTKDEADEIRGINLTSSSTATDPCAEDTWTKSSSERWDFDRLVNKWKKHVREDRTRRTGVAVQTGQSAPMAIAPVTTATPVASTSITTSRNQSQLHDQPQRPLSNHATKKPRVETNVNGLDHGRSSSMSGDNNNSNERQLNGTLAESRRKSVRQKQQQNSQLITGSADQTDEVREFKQILQDMG